VFKIGKEVWIEREDFEEVPPKGYKRLFPGNVVRLKGGYVIECTGCARDSAGQVTEVHAKVIPGTKSGTPGADSVKAKAAITWVGVAEGVQAEVRLYDRLFAEAHPDAGGKDFLQSLNPDSLKVVTAYVEPSLAQAQPDQKFQFERFGYFVADRLDHVVEVGGAQVRVHRQVQQLGHGPGGVRAVPLVLGEERVVVFDLPGTTRDSISIDFEREGKRYTLVDTAGMRKRGKVDEAVEKFSVIKTLQSIADANIAILVLDARQEISEQDAHIAGFILEEGRALVVAVNKWEGLDEGERDQIKRDAARKLNFLNFARFHFISALEGQGIGALLRSADEAYAAAMAELATPRLTRALMMAVQQQQPPRAGMVRPKMRYAHQGGSNPPRIIVHGTALESVPDSYRRYLERFFRDVFKLTGTPLRVEFKTGRNPFANRAAKRS
jgi:small GTP-binding protein